MNIVVYTAVSNRKSFKRKGINIGDAVGMNMLALHFQKAAFTHVLHSYK